MTGLREAFLAGFKASGEGWNGEYPFEGVGAEDPRWNRIGSLFDEWLAEAEPHDAEITITRCPKCGLLPMMMVEYQAGFASRVWVPKHVCQGDAT